MDPRKLVRDAKKVLSCVKELTDHPRKPIVALKPVKIYIPSRFAEVNLAQVGVETYIVGIYGMVVEDTYFASSTVNAMIQIEPSSIMKIQIAGEEYYEFGFDAGATIMTSTDLVKTETLPYRIYEELLGKGRVPWYLSYLQMGALFRTAKKHAGANVGENPEVGELLASITARDALDRTKSFRAAVQDLSEMDSGRLVWIPLKSIQFAANNTLNKLAGSYFDQGVVSALVSPADRTERIEGLLRR